MTAPERTERWEELSRYGQHIGSASAEVVVVEFADFQCPFCREFHAEFDAALSREAGARLVFRHLPLSMHPHARAAAIASECAAAQGRFPEMVSAMFSAQDSIGRWGWFQFAKAANVPDSLVFEHCMRDPSTAAAIERDVALADSLGMRATPTVFINGWKLSRAPRADSLVRIIQRVRRGREAF